MKTFFETLHRKNILSKKGVNSKYISALSPVKIRDLCEELISIIKEPSQNIKQNVFVHTASLSLGGGIEDCMNLPCRLRNLDSLARFAVMYSDKVYIDNFLARYVHGKSRIKARDGYLNFNFYNDIFLLNFIQPLLENGTIVLFTSPEHWCPSCIAASSFGKGARKRVKGARKQLMKDYFLNTTVKFEYRNNKYRLRCTGPEPYFEHGGLIYEINKPKDALLSVPRIIDSVRRGEEVILPKGIKKKLKLHNNFANQAMINICFGLSVAQVNNSSFVTNKDLHLSLLKEISNNLEIEKRNKIAFDHLATIVPFLEDIEISNLIKLRNREYQSFVIFRQALNKAIDEFRSKKDNFTIKDARSLYSDVINPQLVSLERRMKTAKKDLLKKSYRSVLACVGVISFGLYCGFIPSELRALASSMGLVKFGTDFLKELMVGSDMESTIENDSLFFLWKVKELPRSLSKL